MEIKEKKLSGQEAREVSGEHVYLVPFAEVTLEEESSIGGKARNLLFLARNGLPVPEGACILTSAHNYYRKNGSLPDGLVEDVLELKEKLNGKVAIRSSATCEDGKDLSMAGVFSTYYIMDYDEVQAAIESIYHQADSHDVAEYLRINNLAGRGVEMGIVVQRLIEPDYAGVLYTEVNDGCVLMQYVHGFGEKLVDGRSHGASLLLAKESGQVEQSSGYSHIPLYPRVVQRISQLGSVIESLYGDSPQDVEFAIKDEEVYILQTRPMTRELDHIELEETPEDTLEATKEKFKQIVEFEKKRLGTEHVILSNSNFSELLPRPTEMDVGVFSYIFTGSDGIPGAIQLGRKEMGYQIDDSSVGYMYYVGGKPYFSITGDALTYHIGIPETREEYLETLVSEYLQAIEEDPEKGNYPEIGLYLQDPTLTDLESRYSERASKYYAIYQGFIAGIEEQADEFALGYRERQSAERSPVLAQVDLSSLSPDDLVSHSEALLEHMRTVSCVDFVKAARLGFYYSQRLIAELRKVGIKNEIEVFAQLTQGLEGSEITEVNIELARANSDEAAYGMARELIGHYSTKEMLEIKHPRLKDNEESITSYVDGIRRVGYEGQFREQQGLRAKSELDFLERVDIENRDQAASIMRAAQKYLALRETIKYSFVKEYALLRDGLEQLGKGLGLGEGDIYFIYPRELRRLAEDGDSMFSLIHARKQAYENYVKLSLPAVVRERDVDLLSLQSDQLEEPFVEAKGKFLSGGSLIDGVIINLEDNRPEDLGEILAEYRSDGVPIILAAVQINLGHDPYIAQASGIIIQNAGITSHGAQRARELGKGAIGGISVAKLKTGMRVRFDPKNKEVKALEEASI